MRLHSLAPVLALSAFALATSAQAESTLVTANQKKIDRAAVALLADPAVKAARDAVVKSWAALPIAGSKDGKEQLEGAVDDLVFASARDAVERNQFNPSISWIETPPYKVGADAAPGGRFGVDAADRIYRSVSVSPSLRYVIKGQRAAQPSNRDFLIEVHQSLVSRVLVSLWAKDVDVGPDGSFTITVDSTPANGRRNHLTLPEGAASLLIRDTVADWNSQSPNRLTIEVVGGAEPPHGGPEQARAETLANVEAYAKLNIKFLNDFTKTPANEIKLAVRGGEEGVVGNIIGVGRFSLNDDEALVATLDPQDAGYLGFQLNDPWGRSLPYWDHVSGLSDRQAKKNADGSITYIVAPRDPGYANWVDTAGLHDGLVAVRFEDFAKADPAKIVRQWKLVKLADLAQALPAGAARVSPAEREAELAARKASFAKRLVD